jgi:hypothetical protein
MGGLLLFVGLAVLGFGLFNHLKGKRILAAPFKKTGELAKNPVSEDPKGAMSTEGKVIAPAQELLSPASKAPCLYYELKIERLYEKTETTQDGTKTVKGSETLETLKGGAVFGLDDGSGAIQIDVSKGADFDVMKDGFKKELNGWGGSSHVQFGEYTFDVPVIGSDKGWTIGFKATEKYVPVEGNLFVLGKVDGGKIIKPGWRSMMASTKGREGLLGSIQKKKKFSFIGGGAAAVLSIPLMIFGPKADPNAVSHFCESTLTDGRARCESHLSDKDGHEMTWTVTKPGHFDLAVYAPQKKISLDPQLVVKSATDEVLADVEAGTAGTAKASLDLKPGTYKLVVKPADGFMVKGGFDFDLEINATAAAAATPAVAEGDAKPAGEKQTFDAPKLAAEFLKDAAGATARIDHQPLEVKGLVKDVMVEVDTTMITFQVPSVEGKFGAVFAMLPAKATVKKGQVVTVRGEAQVVDGDGIDVNLLNAELVLGGANTAAAPKAAAKPAPKAVAPRRAPAAQTSKHPMP